MMKRGAMLTVLSSLLTALAWPATLLGATDFIDSKWTLALNRSDKAGKVLADVLLKGGQGSRPVTLIGFSLGARVVFACLEELAKRGDTGGIVERVVLLGAPLVLNTRQWQTVRKVVAGRFINGYSTNDWMLGVIYRATFFTQGLAGLQAVNMPGIENVDVTEIVKGHSSYLSKVGDILQAIDIDSFYPTHPSKIQRRKL
jgi:pimeloyl-ACP methyl ester carboxylesterase